MKPYLVVALAFAVQCCGLIAAPQYVCTARNLLGKSYHSVGENRELTMLQALQDCESENLRCVRGSCRQASSIPHSGNPGIYRYQVGDKVLDMCWDDDQGQQVCLNQYKGVKVLLYNAGWCGPCNSEFDELSTAVQPYLTKATFIGVSGNGWSQRSNPDQAFLKQWRSRHNIPTEVVIAGKKNDFGQTFGHGSIPNVAVINKDNVLTYTDVAPGVEEILRQVDAAQ
jgi:peroxiredoxin